MRAVFFSGELDDTGTEGEIPAAMAEQAARAREVLLESAADLDDAIAEKFLEEQEPDPKELRAAIRRGCIELKIVPVACGTALRNKGIRPLLDAVVDYLPSPAELPPVEGVDPRDRSIHVQRAPRDKEPLAALAFKVAMDEGRKLVFLRIFSGVLEVSRVDLQCPGPDRTRRSPASS